MASMLKKAIVYLGLGPDEEYDGVPAAAVQERPAEPTPEAPPAVAIVPERPEMAPPIVARTPQPEREPFTNVRPVSQESPVMTTAPHAVAPRPHASSPVVRTLPPVSSVEARVVAPDSFNEAQNIADRFKSGEPVVIDLRGADRDLSRRLIDFASGVCYGIGGSMNRASTGLYVLAPDGVELPDRQKARLADGDAGA